MKPVPTDGPRYITLADAAELCSTAKETIRKWVWLGHLRAYRPGRAVLLREDELRAFIESRDTRALRAAAAKERATTHEPMVTGVTLTRLPEKFRRKP
jgi:excisionase family DNA binding protein